MKKKIFINTLLLFIVLNPLYAQFYNGHQMTFGKNRVQYNNFYWSYFHFEKFDTYFNQDGKAIAEYTCEHASKEISAMEKRLNHKLKKRLTFLVYNKFSDFKQSNVGLVTGNEAHNIGGVTKIKNNKVSLYFQGNHSLYLKEMRAAIAEVIIKEMLYGSKYSENITNTSISNPPEWYFEGLIAYLSENWSIKTENRIKDGFANNKFKKFNKLTGDNAVYAGYSFWKYINDYYGANAINDIIYITRINKNINNAIKNVLGLSFKEINKQWLDYYKDYFENDNIKTEEIEGNNILQEKQNALYYSQAKLNPLGNKIAYVSNKLGQYKIWIYDLLTEENHRILKRGYKIKQINDYTYPVIAWHPSGEYLTIITEEKGGLKLLQYILEKDEITERNLLYFDKILSLSYSDNGAKLVFSAVKNSKTDIFIYDIASATHKRITNDNADDFNPRFINNSEQIIFSSNRLNDSLNTKNILYGNQFDLYTYNIKSKKRNLSQLTNTLYQNETQAFEIHDKEYLYLNDKNGIHNLYQGKYDSTISFIDTTIHYKYFLSERPLTNYSKDIISHHLNKLNNRYLTLNYQNNKFQITKHTLGDFSRNKYQKLQFTQYRNKLNNELRIADSIKKSEQLKQITDTSNIIPLKDYKIDINNYVFETENPIFTRNYLGTKKDSSSNLFKLPKIRIYQRTFYTNHIVSQIDFGFLNSTYQAFTGGAVYFNPGFNALLKIGAYDLLEDYKLVAGVRFSADFHSNEYLFSLENLKKKIDEQYVYHRQTFKNSTIDFMSKTKTNKFIYIRTLPFNEVRAIKGSLILRYDKMIFLSTNWKTLRKDDSHRVSGGIKLDYIFDNTIKTGINLYNGTRYKIFAEYYNQLNKSKTDLFVIGADFRHYQKIHRDLIFAARFATSTSFGHNKLIYYLGGVDNWTNFSQKKPTFIPLNEIPINEDAKYAYQAVATNLRGFPQNIRNGNSFALINTELRLPVVKYFSNTPINSSFWNNLQLVGFFDVGTAWSGISPYSNKNGYDKLVIDNNSLKITIDTEREPFVAGYGCGLRLMLFGYFARFDWAWGIENKKVNSGIFYFSLSLDF
ncbi:MAG: hypothetical protein MI739_06225 [Bacteroidales bacterium]|nr:hypothetical protein [Bacteroidales bacterium]